MTEEGREKQVDPILRIALCRREKKRNIGSCWGRKMEKKGKHNCCEKKTLRGSAEGKKKYRTCQHSKGKGRKNKEEGPGMLTD